MEKLGRGATTFNFQALDQGLCLRWSTVEQLVDYETSNPFSSLLVGLLRFRKSLSPHRLAVFIALFPYCHLPGLYHMRGLPLWLPRSRSYHDGKVCAE